MALSKLKTALISGLVLATGSQAFAQDERVLARTEMPQNIELSDQKQNVLPISGAGLDELTAVNEDSSILIEFQDLSTDKPLGTYYEVYLVSKAPDQTQAMGRYVGNLDFYGVYEAKDDASRSKSIDVTKVYRETNFGDNGVAVMLQAAAPDAQNASPKIGGVEFMAVEFNQ